MQTEAVAISSSVYTRVSAGIGKIEIESKKTGIKVVFQDEQPIPYNYAFHEMAHGELKTFGPTGTNTWVIATEDTAETHYVSVTESLNVIEVSNRGGAGVAVFVQDQTTGPLDLAFLQEISAPTLAADTIIGSRVIELTAGHGLTAGNIGQIIEIASTVDGTKFIQCEISAVSGDDITLDSPVNNIYTPASSILAHSAKNMAVDGPVTPQIFKVAPTAAQAGDITRIIFGITDGDVMDFETFGGIPVLENGVVIRINNGDGTYRHLFNFKANGDIIIQSFDHSFFANNANNVRGFNVRLTWAGQSKHGVAIRLEGALLEALELVVQDDLSDLLTFSIVAQGSELQN